MIGVKKNGNVDIAGDICKIFKPIGLKSGDIFWKMHTLVGLNSGDIFLEMHTPIGLKSGGTRLRCLDLADYIIRKTYTPIGLNISGDKRSQCRRCWWHYSKNAHTDRSQYQWR